MKNIHNKFIWSTKSLTDIYLFVLIKVKTRESNNYLKKGVICAECSRTSNKFEQN